MSLLVGMASIPERRESLDQALESLCAQTVRDWGATITLNGYPSIPDDLPTDNRIQYRLADNSMGACEKFHPLTKQGWLFTVDDDIIYPPNYFESMLEASERYPGCAMSVHGSRLRFPFLSFKKHRIIYNFRRALVKDAQIHLVGTGTLLLHTDWIKPEAFLDRSSADLWASLALTEEGILKIAVRRPNGWLKQIPGFSASTVWQSNSVNHAAATLHKQINLFEQERSIEADSVIPL